MRLNWKSVLKYRNAGGIVSVFFTNAKVVVMGSLISKILTMGSGFLLAWILGKASFGRIGVIQSAIALFMSFAGLGLGSCASKYVAELKDSDPQRAGRIIAMTTVSAWIASLLASLLMMIFATSISVSMLGSSTYIFAVMFGAVTLGANAINGSQQGVLSGLGDFNGLMRANILSSFVTVLVGSLLAVPFRENGAMAGMMIGSIATNLYCRLRMKAGMGDRGIVVRVSEWMVESKLLLKFSLPSFVVGLFLSGSNWLGIRYLVSTSDGINSMGTINIAFQWRLLVMAIPTMLSVLILPMFSEANKNVREKKKLFAINFAVNLSSGIAVCSLLYFFGETIMMLIGKEYCGNNSITLLIAVTAVLSTLTNLVSRYILSTGKMVVYVISDCSWGVAFLILSRVLIDMFNGARGFAFAIFGAAVIQALVQVILFLYQRRKSSFTSSAGGAGGLNFSISNDEGRGV